MPRGSAAATPHTAPPSPASLGGRLAAAVADVALSGLSRVTALLTGALYYVWAWPLERLFYDGPAWGGFGGWQGQPAADICAALTNVPAAVWSRDATTAADCAALLQRRFHALLVGASVLAYVVLAYNAARAVWHHCVVEPRRARLLADALVAARPPPRPAHPAASPQSTASSPGTDDSGGGGDGSSSSSSPGTSDSSPLARLEVVLRRASSTDSSDTATPPEARGGAVAPAAADGAVPPAAEPRRHRRASTSSRHKRTSFTIELRRRRRRKDE